MRPLTDVIDAVKTLIPNDFENKKALVESLEVIKENAKTTEEGAMHVQWGNLIRSLDEHGGQPEGVEWFDKIVDVVNGTTDYKDLI